MAKLRYESSNLSYPRRTMFTRRQFLKAGIAGGALLVAVRAAYGPFSPDPRVREDLSFKYALLDSTHRSILAGIAPVMLAGALPADAAERQSAILEVIRGVDRAAAGLPPAVQDEVAQLFALLGFPLTRRLLAGVRRPWLDADSESIQRFLERWRDSPLALLRSAYAALHELIMAAWYGNSVAWSRIGYAGPPALTRN
ncbi:MAG TPA: hypothetical protein VFB54_15570 [Burkholderiales bacterium]|nr:hypothetical protein [Burkholderiales bacterium]